MASNTTVQSNVRTMETEVELDIPPLTALFFFYWTFGTGKLTETLTKESCQKDDQIVVKINAVLCKVATVLRAEQPTQS